MQAKGVTGQLEFIDDYIIISRKGAMAKMNHGLAGDKKIPIRSILSVQWKAASSMVNGYLQFATAARESSGGIMAATKDENTVVFKKKYQSDFEAIRDSVEKRIAELHEQTNQPMQIITPVDVADQIRKLAELRDQGILTTEEFDAQKAKILG